MFPEEVNP
jgi:MFS family permease